MNNLLIALMVASSLLHGQTTAVTDKPFIEVSGSSETEITPDEIFITITLLERYEGKEKLGIEKQEDDLKKNLKELGIELSNLTMNSAYADYQKIKAGRKDVINSRSYTLKVGDAATLNKVYERLDIMNAHDAYISKINHTKLLEYQKENRIKAIKAAKEKAEYLLGAIGKLAGSPLQVSESDNWVENNPNPPMYRGGRGAVNAIQTLNEVISGESGQDISFKKIKIRSGYLVKFEIINR